MTDSWRHGRKVATDARAWMLSALAWSWVIPQLDAQELVNLAEDDAGNYGGGWHTGSNGGYGFGPWQLTARHGEERSYAGFFVARKENHSDLQNITRDAAFGLYANGVEFEQAVAFRSLEQPLRAGDAFSILIEHAQIPRGKDSEPSATRSFGLVLRADARAESPDDWDSGARFTFASIQGLETYRILDGESPEKWDTGLQITESGIEVTFILVDPDHYDLQVKVLETDQVHAWQGRQLGGLSEAAIASFALFKRDAGGANLYFQGLQINREKR